MNDAFILLFGSIFIIGALFWYSLYWRGVCLCRKVKEVFSSSDGIEEFPEKVSESAYMMHMGGTIVLSVKAGDYIIYLHRRLLVEAIKFNWHLVVVFQTPLDDGFYGSGFHSNEVKRKGLCEVFSKSIIDPQSTLFANADYVEVKAGKAFCFKQLGSLAGTSGLYKMKESMLNSNIA